MNQLAIGYFSLREMVTVLQLVDEDETERGGSKGGPVEFLFFFFFLVRFGPTFLARWNLSLLMTGANLFLPRSFASECRRI
jgi:hypothetical protein